MSEAHKGNKLTEQHRRNIGLSLRGLEFTPSRRKVELILCACGCGKTLDRHDINGRERRYIYNHFMPTFVGKHHTLESRTKSSESHRGKTFTKAHRKKLGQAQKYAWSHHRKKN